MRIFVIPAALVLCFFNVLEFVCACADFASSSRQLSLNVKHGVVAGIMSQMVNSELIDYG